MVNTIRVSVSVALYVFALLSCTSGSENPNDEELLIESFELIDPTSGPNNRFGSQVVILDNGNIVVTSLFDSSSPPDTGAVHLFNPYTQSIIASFYGNTSEGDLLTLGGVVGLVGGNYVVASPATTENNVSAAGSVRLFNGTTGNQIGASITGDNDHDRLGYHNGVVALTNGNYVIATANDDVNGIEDAGSIKIINGLTGLQIGSDIVGMNTNDSLGVDGVFALANGNFVVASSFHSPQGIVNAGSIILVDGETGSTISAFAGFEDNDELGGSGIIPLPNGNFVVPSPVENANGIEDAGVVRLINGNSGLPIGTAFVGDNTDDEVGEDGVLALPNGNFVVASADDDIGGFVDAGSVRLFSGTTGLPIGAPIIGEETSDRIGFGGLTALGNSNFLISSPRDSVNGVQFGSVILVDGSTGAQIGAKISGDLENDFVSLNVKGLTNNNFVIGAREDDENGVANAGSVRLVDGTSGVIINTIAGNEVDDQLSFGAIVGLRNSNIVIASANDNENGIDDSGSVRVLDGSTGMPIGAPIIGDNPMDRLGNQLVESLSNGNFLVISGLDDQNGVVDAGSVMLVSGETGEVKELFLGVYPEDIISSSLFTFPAVHDSENFQFFVLALPIADHNGVADSGRVLLRKY